MQATLISPLIRRALRISGYCFGVFVLSCGSSFASSKDVVAVKEQRIQYENAINAIENKDLKKFSELKSTIIDYPLYPYLDYREFILELESVSINEILDFETKYADLPFVSALRGRYLQILAKNKDWSGILTYQTKSPIEEAHQCNYYFAHSKKGDKKRALAGAKSLYLSGNSIHSACDKLFVFLKESNELDDDLVINRMLLAFEKKNITLLRYLKNQLTDKAKDRGEQIIDLYEKPALVADFARMNLTSTDSQRLTQLAFKRLVAKNPSLAAERFSIITQAQLFDENESQQMADILISRLMSTNDENLSDWRDYWLESSKNHSLLERRFRSALVANDWVDIERWLDKMPEDQASQPTWLYWRARVLQKKGQDEQAKSILSSITGQRHFYSVAAAMHLGEEIKLPYRTVLLNINDLQPFQPSLKRIEELIALNKLIESKREWYLALKRADQKQQEMLAAFALEQRWYHLSVQATIMGKLWEHLEVRFPVAHRWWFEFFSKEREVPLTTLLALSRQESAFHSKAVSPVGARGLMQLMPATAKETSEKLGVDYRGRKTLNDPSTNIQLGSGYLRILLDDFEENRILAFAAYNAGPHRVQTWLERTKGNLDVIGFIEAIPFQETRGYVQNVLMYEIYYSKLLGMPLQFLYEGEIARNY